MGILLYILGLLSESQLIQNYNSPCKEQTQLLGGVSQKPGGLAVETWDACDQTTILPPLGNPVGKGWTGGVINTGNERQMNYFWVGEGKGRRWPGGADFLLYPRRATFLCGCHHLIRSKWACGDFPMRSSEDEIVTEKMSRVLWFSYPTPFPSHSFPGWEQLWGALKDEAGFLFYSFRPQGRDSAWSN